MDDADFETQIAWAGAGGLVARVAPEYDEPIRAVAGDGSGAAQLEHLLTWRVSAQSAS